MLLGPVYSIPQPLGVEAGAAPVQAFREFLQAQLSFGAGQVGVAG